MLFGVRKQRVEVKYYEYLSTQPSPHPFMDYKWWVHSMRCEGLVLEQMWASGLNGWNGTYIFAA